MELHNTLQEPARIAISLQRGTLHTTIISNVATAAQHSNLPMQVCRTRTDKRKLSSLELALWHSENTMSSTQGSLVLSQR